MNLHTLDTHTARTVGRFRIVAATTVWAVVFLILVGALVRMTGSGMGCPDWPKCFGQWIPPTDISQLPADYKTRFEVAGREIADFDAFKTWVEYINRLIGVLIGILSLATVVAAYPLRKKMRSVWLFSLAGLLGVLVVGGVGAYVVRTHLEGGVVTVHMMLALGVLGLFVTAWLRSYQADLSSKVGTLAALKPYVKWVSLLTLAAVAVQIVLGTQVREGVDLWAEALGESARGTWLENLGWEYSVHKRFQYVVVGLIVWMGILLKPWLQSWQLARNIYLGSLAAVGAAILLGLGMHHLEIPQWMQPSHLLVATLLFGTAWGMTLLVWIRPSEADLAPDIPQQSEIAPETAPHLP